MVLIIPGRRHSVSAFGTKEIQRPIGVSPYQPDTRAYERDDDDNMLDGQYFMVYVRDSSESKRDT